MFVLHGNLDSPSARIVLLCAAEMGLPDTAFKMEQCDWSNLYDPAYVQHHPFRQIPWFEDTEAGLKLYEVRAICKYMAVKVDSPLIVPMSDPVKYAQFELACSIELSHLYYETNELNWQLIWNPKYMNKPTNQAVVDFLKAQLGKHLTGLDRVLSKQDYLAGDSLTLADLFAVPNLAEVEEVGVLSALLKEADPPRKHVQAWYDRLVALESWKKIKAQGDAVIAAYLQKQEEEKRKKEETADEANKKVKV